MSDEAATSDEFELYERDPVAWAAQAAPKWIPMLEQADDERLQFLCNAARPELKRALWALADDKLKTRIKTITGATQ